MKVEIACSLAAKLRGLAGRNAFDGVLLLVPCNDVHTFTMHCQVDIAFVAADGTVLESLRDVPPRRRMRNRKAVAVIERYSSCEWWPMTGDILELSHSRDGRKFMWGGDDHENMPGVQ